jgi:hypothetical protein
MEGVEHEEFKKNVCDDEAIFLHVLLVSNLCPFSKFGQEQRQCLTCRIL